MGFSPEGCIKMGFFDDDEKKLKKIEDRLNKNKTKTAAKNKIILDKEKLKQTKLQSKVDVIKEKKETKRLYDIVRHNKIYSIKGFWYRFKDKFISSKQMLIHMELNTGMHVQFLVTIKKNKFVFKGGTYVVDDSLKYYDVSSKYWCSDYHQDVSLPILRKIDSTKLKKIIRMEGITDVDTAINPFALKYFIEGEVIQKVLQGVELDKAMRFLKLVAIISLLVVLANFLLNLQTSGVLAGLGI